MKTLQATLFSLDENALKPRPSEEEEEERYKQRPGCVASPTILRLVPASSDVDIKWCKEQITTKHYKKQDVHDFAKPLYYMVMLSREPVGVLVFGRMQSSRCAGWYGTLDDIASGWAQYSQWELLCLMRLWIDPRLQRKYESWYMPNAASCILGKALKQVSLDYLCRYPPVFFDRPWLIRQVISYCQTDRFFCTSYLASGFRLQRVNKKGLRTYVHDVVPLNPREIEKVYEASRTNKKTQHKREQVRARTRALVQPAILRRKKIA